MKKQTSIIWALLLILSLTITLAATSVSAAAVTPSIDYTGEWSDDGTTLILTGKVNNPNNKFYSGAVALDYDTSLFEVTDNDISAETDFSIIKGEVDSKNGHIRTDLAYLGGNGGLEPSSTPTNATKIKLKLKNGKTKNDVKQDSVEISDDDAYIKSLGTSYSGGAVTIYGSKNKTNDTVTKFGKKDSTADGSVTLPTDEKTIKSIEPVKATTTVGKAPTLPDKVKVTYSDGSTAEVAVKWDDIPAANYSKEGSFKVNGTVAGTSLKAEATVTVNKAGTSSTSSTTSTTTTTTTKASGGGTANTTSKTGDNVRALTFMGILLGASVIVIVIVLLTSRKNKGK